MAEKKKFPKTMYGVVPATMKEKSTTPKIYEQETPIVKKGTPGKRVSKKRYF